MSKSASAVAALPFPAADALAQLGASLRIARERRGESLRAWAERMNTSVPTLQRMERGDPTVGSGVYATAIWLMGKSSELAALAAPENDHQALAQEVLRSRRGARA